MGEEMQREAEAEYAQDEKLSAQKDTEEDVDQDRPKKRKRRRQKKGKKTQGETDKVSTEDDGTKDHGENNSTPDEPKTKHDNFKLAPINKKISLDENKTDDKLEKKGNIKESESDEIIQKKEKRNKKKKKKRIKIDGVASSRLASYG